MQKTSLFIDTNIILDLLDDTRNSHMNSKKLIEHCLCNDLLIAISDDIITTVYYLSQKNISRQKLLEFIKFLSKHFKILVFDRDVIDETVDICLHKHSYDFEDTLQAICAKKHQFSTLITNDKKFPKLDNINIITPKEFLENHIK